MSRAAVAAFAPCLLGLAAPCLVALGCAGGPYRLLVASTPDRRHRVEIIEHGGRTALVSDGRRGPELEAILPATLGFDAAGAHVAYVAQDGAGHRLALDHCLGPRVQGIGELVFAPGGERLAYAAEERAGWRVVSGGEPGPLVAAVFAGTLGFSRDGAHLLYAAAVPGGARVFLDQTPGPLFDAVAQLQLAPDGTAAYVGRRGAASVVVHAGQQGPPLARIGVLRAGAAGNAYAGWSAGRWALYWQDRITAYAPGAPELAVSSDGSHVAWVGALADGSRIWLDGVAIAGPYARVRPGSLVFAPGQALPSAVVEREPGQLRALIGGREQPAVQRLGALAFSADGQHVAYAAERAGRSLLVVDGREQPLPGPIAEPVLSPDGSRVGFVPRDGPARVLVDGREHGFEIVLPDTLAFSASGRHWAVLAADRSQRRLFFAIDGQPGPELDLVELLSEQARAEARGAARPRAELLRDWARAQADAVEPAPAASHVPAWLAGHCLGTASARLSH